MLTASDPGGHAVVIGASMAGLAIAKALAGTFERVTVLDRDDLPVAAEHRRGVPQGRHLHVLLTSGREALEELFPGVTAAMAADDALVADLGSCARMCVNGHQLALEPSGDEDVVATRPLLEAHVRRRLRETPGVTLLERHEARRAVPSDDGRRVVGVEVAAGAGGSETETLRADLVVDCSGRRSPVPGWLEQLGYPPPEVDELHIDLQYTTRRYRLPADVLDGDLLALIAPTPDEPRGGFITRIEGGLWLVTLAGMGGACPPTDPAGFEAYAASLATSDVSEAIRAGDPVDEPARYRYPSNLRRRYERLRGLPDGLLVAGDAVCSFNPIYGQGMTVAALEAVTLQRMLADGGVLEPRAWFRGIAPIVEVPWDLAIGGDLAVRCIEGRRSLQTRLVNAYMERYYRAAVHDPTLGTLFGRVTSLLEPPERLMRPATVTRVVRGNLRRRPRRTTPSAPSRPRGTAARSRRP